MLLAGCSTKKSSQTIHDPSTDLKPFTLKFELGPCFGSCPVYTFYLLSDQTGLVHAKANLMDTAGWYFTNPDQEAIIEILEMIEPQEWWNIDLSDEPEIADLPSSSLTYHHPKGMRTMTIQSRTTQAVENVFGKLGHLVSESHWVRSDLRPLEQGVTNLNVIVQLKAGIDINTWMKKFDRFGIQLIRKLTSRHHYYLVSKDPEKGNANDFLQYIKSDPDVIGAQWDKQVQQRK